MRRLDFQLRINSPRLCLLCTYYYYIRVTELNIQRPEKINTTWSLKKNKKKKNRGSFFTAYCRIDKRTQLKTFGWKIFSCTICGIRTKLHITSAVTPVDAHTSDYSVVITALYHYSTHTRTHTHRTDGQARCKQHQLHWSGWEWLKLGHIDTELKRT